MAETNTAKLVSWITVRPVSAAVAVTRRIVVPAVARTVIVAAIVIVVGVVVTAVMTAMAACNRNAANDGSGCNGDRHSVAAVTMAAVGARWI